MILGESACARFDYVDKHHLGHMISLTQSLARAGRLTSACGSAEMVGIRIVTPFEGMVAQVDMLLKELREWVNQRGLAEQGPYFLRCYFIDGVGDMDIEVSFVVKKPVDRAIKLADKG